MFAAAKVQGCCDWDVTSLLHSCEGATAKREGHSEKEILTT